MTNDTLVEQPMPILPMLRREFISIILLGAATGLVVWGLGLLFDRYVFDVYFCQSDISRQCGSAKNYAALLAGLIGAVVALIGLIRLGVYRPLLIVIATVLSAWDIVQLSWGLDWFVGLIISIFLYATTFGLFSWVARIREFWITLVVMVFLVVAVRLALVA